MLIDISLGGTKQLKERLKQFNLTTWCICQLYLSCLGKYSSGVFKKAVVRVIPDKTDNNVIEDMVDVISVYKTFDFEKFFQLKDKYAKKKMLLEVLQDGLLTMAKQQGWNIDPLLDSYNCCIKKNLEHKWLRHDKYLLSPGRKYYAGIFCHWDIDKFEVF